MVLAICRFADKQAQSFRPTGHSALFAVNKRQLRVPSPPWSTRHLNHRARPVAGFLSAVPVPAEEKGDIA